MGHLKGDTPGFGFSLDRAKGAYLRRLLESGQEVRVKAVIRSWLYEGSFFLPTGVIPGETDEEIMVFAHAYEFGAEDNASGCATALEAARALNALIQRGQLPRPRRTIRVMMSWECYGSIPWCVDRILERRNVVAGLCLDDLGGKKQLTGGQATLILNAHCQASFTDFMAIEIAEACLPGPDGASYRISDWQGGTDHTVFQDPMFGVPMPWLTEHPARFHHTSLDTMDNIDTQGLHREGVFAATYLYLAANAGAPEGRWLALGTRKLWEQSLSKGQEETALALADASPEAFAEQWLRGHRRLDYLMDRGADAIRSIRRLVPAEELDRVIDEEILQLMSRQEQCADAVDRAARAVISSRKKWPAQMSDDVAASDVEGRVPRRLTPGLVTLCTISDDHRSRLRQAAQDASPMWSPTLIFALYWADGARSIHEIGRLVEQEHGPTDIDLVAYFELLHELGHIAWA